MPQTPSCSPATGKTVPPYYIHTIDGKFVDAKGRTLLLRGVNLSGSCKAAVGRESYKREGFFEEAEAGGTSFVGRPLNLEDGSADIHLARLRGWGFNMLRYVFTWEALEREGPGIYDFEFMDYTVQVLRKCKEYGFKVYMDPHQDIWSRFSGGSGAPYWTLHACGMNPRNFTATQATLLHCEYPTAKDPKPAEFPAMIWSTEYQRLAAQTLFALFFAGRDFAPNCIIDGVNIQDYLQTHFLDAVAQLGQRIRDAGDLLDECVIGWDSYNEPSEGFIGHADLREIPKDQALRKGSCPTPMESLKLGMGEKVTVEYYEFGSMGPKKSGTVTIDPKGRRAWLRPEHEPNGVSKWGWKRDPGWTLGTCPWAMHCVWDPVTGICLQPDYFSHKPDDPEQSISFVRDYWLPHWQAYSARIKTLHPEAIHFIQPPVFVIPPRIPDEDICGRACYAPHYYDGLTLLTRHWNWFNADALGLLRGKYSSMFQAIKIGETAIRKSLREQLAMFLDDAQKNIGNYPTLIGEIGTPFDMDGKKSYGYTENGKHKGDYSAQQRALDASLNAADGTNMINWTVWTYCPDSTHEWGDGWNMEDLSLYSDDDLQKTLQEDPYRSSYASTASSSTANLSVPSTDKLLLNTQQLVPTLDMSMVSLPLSSASSYTVPPAVDYATGNLYRFLKNGARACRAYSRPWPTAVVGSPTSIEFDIPSATFTLTVSVGPEDKPRETDNDDDPKEPPTEIYLPVVHYATDALIRKGLQPRTNKTREGRLRGRFSRSHSALSVREADSASVTAPASPMTAASSPVDSLGQGFGSSQATLVSSLVDVDVQVSAGSYEVTGQTLFWWYPVPQEGDGKVQYTIRVKRRTGPIKSAEQNAETCWESDSCRVM